jgi:hypothetical protein
MKAAAILGVVVLCTQSAAESKQIVTQHSSVTIYLDKSGLFSFMAHDHVIEAPLAGGEVDVSGSSVQVWFEAAKMRVLDPKLSEGKRAEVQKTMEGPSVLDIERYPEIRFHSTAVESGADERWRVRGILALHGHTREIMVQVGRVQDRYRGATTFRQTEFGITPVSIAGGTVKVKDQVRIEFEVALAP